MSITLRRVLLPIATATCLALATGVAGAQGMGRVNAASAAVFDYWTPERRDRAIPRDFIIDPRGFGYLRLRDGTLVPHGHNIAAQGQAPRAARERVRGHHGACNQRDGPRANPTIGSSYTFRATVSDPSGVKAVTFKVQKAPVHRTVIFRNQGHKSRSLVRGTTGIYRRRDWTWRVVAKDGASRGGGRPRRQRQSPSTSMRAAVAVVPGA